jgi:hypothetical protein
MSETKGRHTHSRARLVTAGVVTASAITTITALASAPAVTARAFPTHPFTPGSVVIASSEYPAQGNPVVQLGQPLPSGAAAVSDGKYPEVWNNDGPDGSFAVATPITLTDVTSVGNQINKTSVPTDQVTTSFSSKSELAINFSSDGQDLSFFGYNAAPNALDSSNSNTPGLQDKTNLDTEGPYYRVAANLDADGNWTFTDSNAYSGDNSRAVVLDKDSGLFYAAGNSNNGSLTATSMPPLVPPTLADLAKAGGAQVFAPSDQPQSAQNPGAPTPLGTFSITEVPGNPKPDKLGKDTNFRGLTLYNGVVYETKGSGGNGINTVYWVNTDSAHNPCVDGQGLPETNQPLPTIAGSPYPMCILKGFNTTIAKNTTDIFPFGLWFANDDTLYVADEGDGNLPYDHAGSQVLAGLQKWTFDGTEWQRQYTLQSGLNLGQPYKVPAYPTGTNSITGEPWGVATDGLRNISGQNNGDGTATIYAATSTVSGSGDQGADPNEVVKITDDLDDSGPTVPDGESFTTIAGPKNRIVYRGVAVVPADYGSPQNG